MIAFCYVVPALLVAALIASGVWGSNNRARAEELERTNRGIYSQAYTELTDSVYNMHIALSKLMVSEAPSTLTETLDDIWRESGTIAGLMGRIPQSHTESYELNRFLIQIGDYARSLSGALRRGGRLSEEDRGQLMEVYTASEAVFNELSENLNSGNIPLSALDGSGFFSVNNGGSGAAAQDEADSRYPTLIYDGPFSESTEKREPRGLTGEDTDENTALKKAREYLEDEGASLKYGGISYGRIPFHGFSGTLSDGSRAEIAVTVRAARLLYMRIEKGDETGADEDAAQPSGAGAGGETGGGNPIEGGAQNPDERELSRLKEAGLKWLERMGYREMEATYAQYYGSSVLISFAAAEERSFMQAGEGFDELLINNADMSELINELRGNKKAGEKAPTRVILYNDLVKLRISRRNGEIIGVDAENYLFSHTEREFPVEIISGAQAAKRLSGNLDIEKTALALIPMPDGSERLCHEFTGSFAEASYIVYLDARTGDEVRIFRIIDDENGTSVL